MQLRLSRIADGLVTSVVGLTPTRLVSRLAGRLAASRVPWLKRFMISVWLRAYPALDMTQAADPDPDAYTSFEAFFTRRLAPGMRPMPDASNVLVSPVDGTLGACGCINSTTLLQAKDKVYKLEDLCADDANAKQFINGSYATFYLAPADYHHIHLPFDAQLTGATYIPGRLFGVGPRFVRAVPQLFTRNERVVLSFATDAGALALVFVGAFIVGGIHTRWHGQVCPPHSAQAKALDLGNGAGFDLARGDIVGHFSIGSSVIMLMAPEAFVLDPELEVGQSCRVGNSIGQALINDVSRQMA